MSGLTVILIPESLDKDALKLVEDSCNPPFAYKGLLNLHEPESRLAALIVEEVKSGSVPYKQEYFIVQTCSVDYPDPIFIVVLRISGQLQIQIHNVARLTLEANHIYQAPGGIVKFWAGKDAWALTLFITLRE